jgi:hypothetical protein
MLDILGIDTILPTAVSQVLNALGDPTAGAVDSLHHSSGER